MQQKEVLISCDLQDFSWTYQILTLKAPYFQTQTEILSMKVDWKEVFGLDGLTDIDLGFSGGQPLVEGAVGS